MRSKARARRALAGRVRLRSQYDREIDRAQGIWPLFALKQPANGAVFALDGGSWADRGAPRHPHLALI